MENNEKVEQIRRKEKTQRENEKRESERCRSKKVVRIE